MSEKDSYKSIMRATTIFGGVKAIQIIIQIVKSKLVAVLLGPEGMGINSLLNSTILLIGSFTSFGLKTSAVKNVAEANSSGEIKRVSIIVGVLRRLVWATGLLGTLVVALLSPQLSEISFGNRNYTLAFLWISISLLLNQLSSGQLVILQGLRKIKYLAKANLSGSIMGLVVTIPLYYYYGIDGIVPAIIASSIASLLRSWFFARKVKFEKVEISSQTIISEGKEMLFMGFMLSLSGLMTSGSNYIVRLFISNIGGVQQVGLYSAGFAIINSYVGMIFIAMSTDYFPRLSSVANNGIEASQTVNQQAEIALLILSPLLIIFIVFANLVIFLLYSAKFAVISSMIQWLALGIFLKTASWAMGFLFLANSDSNLFFKKELVVNIIFLGLNITGYFYYGLEGLGLSFLFGYIINLLIVFSLVYRKYNFRLDKPFIVIFCIQFLLGLVSLFIMKQIASPISNILGSGLIIASIVFSLKELNKRLEIKKTIKKFISNKKR